LNVVVVIEGCEAIPVRAIPLLTNWRFMSPDIVAHVLGGTGGSNVCLFGDMQSYNIEDGKAQPMDKDWWTQFPVRELRALTEKIQTDESSHEAGYSEWRKQSLKELPAGVFVWRDEYQKLHDKCWYNRFQSLYGGLRYVSKEGDDNESTEEIEAQLLGNSTRKDLVNDDPLTRNLWSSLEILKRWRYPNFSPSMRPDLYAVVMEGFETQATTPSPEPVVDGNAQAKQANAMKKAALIAEFEYEWSSIEADISDATRNGLKAAAHTGKHSEWDKDKARAWAVSKGKIKQAAPAHCLADVWPGATTHHTISR
jgi:hypothetical protein